MLKNATDNYVKALNDHINAIRNKTLADKKVTKTHKALLMAKEELRATERELINE